jgi:hypothetical protein
MSRGIPRISGPNGGGGGGGTADLRTATIIVGNATHGDTLDDCDILDPGDGTGIAAALAASAFSDDVFIRGGVYTLGVGVGPLVVPDAVSVRAGGAGAALIICAVSGDQGMFSLGVGCRLEGLTLGYNTFGGVGPFAGSTALVDVPLGNGVEIVNCAFTGSGPAGGAGVPVIDTVIEFGSDNGSRVINCRIQQGSFFSEGVQLVGIRVKRDAGFVWQSVVTGTLISGCDIGISFENSRGGIVSGCTLSFIENVGIQHLVTGNEGGVGVTGLTISGVAIDHGLATVQAKIGVFMQAAANASIRNPHLSGVQIESGNLSNPAGSIGVHLDPNTGAIQEAQLSSVYVGEYATGIQIDADCTDTVVDGVTCERCTTQIVDSGIGTSNGHLNSIPMRGIRDFSNLNFLERPPGSALGGNPVAWEAFAVAILDVTQGFGLGTREIMSCVDQFAGPGWMGGVNDLRPIYATTNGGGGRIDNFNGDWARTATSKQLVFLHTGFDGADAYLFVNADEFSRSATGGFTPATGPFRIGLNGTTANNAAVNMTILGMAFKSDGVLTDAQRRDTIRDFMLNHEIIDGPWTNKFDFSRLALGAVPATVPDLIGALDLTLNGALTVVTDAHATLARTQSPPPDVAAAQPQMVGNVRLQVIDDTLLGVETKLGGFAFNGGFFGIGANMHLTFVGQLTDAGGVAPVFALRLYDMGAPGTPIAGVLRAHADVIVTGSPQRAQTTLFATFAPGVDTGGIHNVTRIYEVRGLLTGDAGDLVEVDWAGIQGD